jgi:hypothetical protein
MKKIFVTNFVPVSSICEAFDLFLVRTSRIFITNVFLLLEEEFNAAMSLLATQV